MRNPTEICCDCKKKQAQDWCGCCGEEICFSCCSSFLGHTTCHRCSVDPERRRLARNKFWEDVHSGKIKLFGE